VTIVLKSKYEDRIDVDVASIRPSVAYLEQSVVFLGIKYCPSNQIIPTPLESKLHNPIIGNPRILSYT
jgi:hypothetical protein